MRTAQIQQARSPDFAAVPNLPATPDGGAGILAMRRIAHRSEIAQLPQPPDDMRGLFDLRGVRRAARRFALPLRPGPHRSDALHIAVIVPVSTGKIQAVSRVVQSTRIDFMFDLVTTGDVMIAFVGLPNRLSVPPPSH